MRFKSISTVSTLTQLARYAFIGLVSNAAGYLLYLLATHFGVAPKLAMTLLYAVGAAIGFLGNRQLTFSHNGGLLGSGFRYALVHLAGYFMNFGILVTFVDQRGYPHQIVQAIAIFIVAAFLFTMFKLFVFRSTPQ